MKSDVTVTPGRLVVARTFRAPRALVFGFWTTAEKYQQWSTCREAVGCEVVMDFRVGGSFTQKMRISVNGQVCEHSMSGVYTEIVEPEKITYTADFGPAVTRATVEFIEVGENTRVVVTHDGFPDDFFRQNVARGTSESFDKLDSILDLT
jgi:uncharacterized protein YndB with AHSA1/START domain